MQDGQIFTPQPKNHGATVIMRYFAGSPLRAVTKTKFATTKRPTANKHGAELELNAQAEGNKARRTNFCTKIVDTYITAKAAVSRRLTQRLLSKNDTQCQPNGSTSTDDTIDKQSRAVEYRDIDLGRRRETTYAETIYAETFVDLSNDNQISKSNLDSSAWAPPCAGEDNDFHGEAHSGAAISSWEDFQCAANRPFRDHCALAPLYEPRLSLSSTFNIDDEAQEDLSRPSSTSSTDRRGSGELLRCLQTGSSVASRLHSRNTSDASAITLPFSEDGDDLKAAAGEGLVVIDEMAECGAARRSVSSHELAVVESSFSREMDQTRESLVDQCGFFEQHVQAPRAPEHVELESYEVKVSQDIVPLGAEKREKSAVRITDEVEICVDDESPKSRYLHVEQRGDEDRHSFTTTTPDEPRVVTRRYGKFKAAFTQQVKDYSKLLDDLADPAATAQALELVSSRLSIYLSNNSSSSANGGFVRPIEAEMPEKRQLEPFSGLERFLDDDDSDSDLRASSAEIFACPRQPMSTPFYDLEQFIADDDLDLDLDLDLDMDTNGFTKPATNSVSDRNLLVDNDEEWNGLTQQDGGEDEDVRWAVGYENR